MTTVGTILFLLAMIGVAISVVYTIIALVKKNAGKRKKGLISLGGMFALLIVSTIIVGVDSDTTPPELTAADCSVDYGTTITVDQLVTATDDSGEPVELRITAITPENVSLADDGTSVTFETTGKYTVSIVGTDSSDNEASTDALVTVTDHTPPIFLAVAQEATIGYGRPCVFPRMTAMKLAFMPWPRTRSLIRRFRFLWSTL